MGSPLLSPEILASIRTYLADLQCTVGLVLDLGDHEKRSELVGFLSAIAAQGDRLKFEERDLGDLARSPLTFLLQADGQNTGVAFSGVPAGHEFNSLILAILQAGGSDLKLDEAIKRQVRSIKQRMNFEVFVSLSCHNCPDIVQLLNKFAFLNENISSEMLDGGLFQDIVDQREILGVPCVFLNGELFASGKVDISRILQGLEKFSQTDKNSSAVKDINLPIQDVVVVGGGPAAVSAAIYSARKGLTVTMIAQDLGGQVKDTMDIENLISVQLTNGPKLTNNLQAHLQSYEVNLREHLSVSSISSGATKVVRLSSGEEIDAKTVIVATGANWRELGIPGEKENIGSGVAFCPHCDGPFFKDKEIVVVGGGNSGIEAALDLSGTAKTVTVLEFLPELKADQILVDRALAKANISAIVNVECNRIFSEHGKVTGIEYVDRTLGEIKTLSVEGVFVQIGLIPNSQFLEGLVKLSPFGEVIINDSCETSESGIFACGDVTTVPFKQIVIAMGEGAKASLSASEYLSELDDAFATG
jgi:alkyl hydroperoxide reductase subunit F